MCGISAYIGHREAYPIVINGLKRLEYRGYDSAGVMIFDGQNVQLSKTKGKVSELEKITDLEEERKVGHIGMGHTRWATHGVPNDVNSHPHTSESGDLVIVHNGIIENYDTIKKELIARGYSFQSDTDTEVLINLIQEVKNTEGCKLGKAVQIALTNVIGAYAISVFDKNKPNEIVVARLGSPIAIGVGKDNKEFFVASDASPFVEYTKNAIYLEDEEMAIIKLGKSVKVHKIIDDKNIVATYEVQADHPVLEGHFPHVKIWPGVYLIEGMNQCAGIHALHLAEQDVGIVEHSEYVTFVTRVDNCKFRSPVFPGNVLTLKATLRTRKMNNIF